MDTRPGRIEYCADPMTDALDDVAALCELWKRNRDRNRAPNAIRYALVMAMRDAVTLCDSQLVDGNAT